MANPAMNDKAFVHGVGNETAMSINGTINKSIGLVALSVISALLTWSYVGLFAPYLLIMILGTFALSLVVIFKKETSPYLAPVYAIAEGMVIAVFSAFFESQYPGIVMQAASATFALFIVMLILYRTRVIQVTDKFRSGVIASTGAIMLLYLVSILGALTGWYDVPFLHDSSPLGIGISVFIVGIASFNLLLDFDIIERGVAARAPKWMEWYASFGVLVTLVWLYIEMLRLIGKIRNN